MSRRWAPRLLLLAVVLVVLDIAAVLLDFEPDHLRLALLVCLAFLAGVVVVDSLGEVHEAWSDGPVRPAVPPGVDPGLAGYVRLVENHLSAASPDPVLRDRLAALCDERLARKHALTRQDPAAETLLGPDLLRDLAGPVRRLGHDEIDRYLERIEKL